MQLEENKLFAHRYRLKQLLGRGGFSEVWLAEDTLTGLEVALKVYAPGGGMDERGVQLFSSEFSLVFNLNHSNLLKPTYYDTFERMPYLVLPYCELGSAANLIGQLDEQSAWRFLHDMTCGLEYLHSQEPPVIHQDIKPDNILLDHSGRYLLTDFGISIKARNTLRKSMLKTEGSVGTLAYMGPERFSKYPLPIKASDIFSLGATLYELLTGMVPFGEHGGLLLQHGAEIPELEGNWSAELKAIVEACLEKDTWARPSATEIRIYCEQYMNGESPMLPHRQTNTVTTSIPEQQKTESEPENIPQQEEIAQPTPEPEIPEPVPTPVETPNSFIESIRPNSDKFRRYMPWFWKAGIPLLFLIIGIAYFKSKQKSDFIIKEDVSIIDDMNKARQEYDRYFHEMDSLTRLGNKSQGENYELYYLQALEKYKAAKAMESDRNMHLQEGEMQTLHKNTLLYKIEETYNLFVTTAVEAEQMQDYDMARIFYQRAARLKPESPVFREFEIRQDSINRLNTTKP